MLKNVVTYSPLVILLAGLGLSITAGIKEGYRWWQETQDVHCPKSVVVLSIEPYRTTGCDLDLFASGYRFKSYGQEALKKFSAENWNNNVMVSDVADLAVRNGINPGNGLEGVVVKTYK